MEEQVFSSLESFLDKTQSYTKTTLELSKLKGLNATTNVITMVVARLCVLMATLLFFVVISIGIALWLGELLGKLYYGFFIIGAAYLIIGFILYFFLHKWINRPFSNLIISQALQ